MNSVLLLKSYFKDSQLIFTISEDFNITGINEFLMCICSRVLCSARDVGPGRVPPGAAQLCCQLIAGWGRLQTLDSGKYFINIGYNKLLQWEIKK